MSLHDSDRRYYNFFKSNQLKGNNTFFSGNKQTSYRREKHILLTREITQTHLCWVSQDFRRSKEKVEEGEKGEKLMNWNADLFLL